MKFSQIVVTLSLVLCAFTTSLAQAYPWPGNGEGQNQPGFPGQQGPAFPDQNYGRVEYYKAQQLTAALYQAVLFRQPDTQGGTETINIVMQQGFYGYLNSATTMPDSPEFQQNIYYRYDAYNIVTNFYRALLGREPDQSAQGYVQQVQSGNVGWVTRAIVSSPEFRRRWGI